MEPLVSVLLPTHNRPDVLRFAIHSVLLQSVDDFELLIVGDGCGDDTREVVHSFADRRIAWFDLPKAPLSGYSNRNVALRQARGQYIAYAQDDDIWFADHLALLLNAIGTAQADWAYSRPLWVGRNGALVPFPVNLTLPDELDYFLTVENSVPSTCVMHTRSALERVGYWPEDVPVLADWQCWRSIIASGTAGNAGFCRSATCMHFPTTMTQHVGLPESAMRESVASCWWPGILRCPSSERSEQETLWHALRDGGDDWLATLRAATDTVLDRVALTAMRQSQSLAATAAAASHAARYQEEARAAREEAALHREALALFRRSRSWRWLAPMRAVATALRR